MHNSRIPGGQSGFSLVEVIITIAIIGILTAGLMTALSSGDDSKITALFSKTQDIVKAVSLYQARTSCTPNNLEVLFNKAMATAAYNFCGQDTTALYGGEDYISAMPVVNTANGSGLDLTKIGFPGAYLWIAQNMGGTNNYSLMISGISIQQQQSLMSKCDGQDYTQGQPMPQVSANAIWPCTQSGADTAMLINKY